MPDGRSPEGCFWCAALPASARHVPQKPQHFPLPFQELLHPMRPHKCHPGGEEGTARTQGKGLGLWLGPCPYSQLHCTCWAISCTYRTILRRKSFEWDLIFSASPLAVAWRAQGQWKWMLQLAGSSAKMGTSPSRATPDISAELKLVIKLV